MSQDLSSSNTLVSDICQLINETRVGIAIVVNASLTSLTLLCWRIGQRIQTEIPKRERAEYGKEILATLSQRLTTNYGSGFSYSTLTHMVQFAQAFPQQ